MAVIARNSLIVHIFLHPETQQNFNLTINAIIAIVKRLIYSN
jgi:hypothetical protein